jgi:hypothetical protein
MLQEEDNKSIQAKETTDNYRELEANGEVYLSYTTSQSPIRTSTALATTVSVPTCAAWGTNAVIYLWGSLLQGRQLVDLSEFGF